MKLSTLSLIFFISFLALSFQNHTTKPFGTAKLTEMNVAYLGLENPVEIITPGYSNHQITLIPEGGNLGTISSGKYWIKPNPASKICSIKIYANEEGKTRAIGAEYFRIKSLPIPIPQLGSIRNDGLPKDKKWLASQNLLLATFDQSFTYSTLRCKVNFYKCKIITTDSIYSFQNNANALTSEIRDQIRRTAAGDIILFYEMSSEIYVQKDTIKAQCPSIVIPII